MYNVCYVKASFDCDVFFSSRRRHTRYWRDWSSDVCSSDLRVGGTGHAGQPDRGGHRTHGPRVVPGDDLERHALLGEVAEHLRGVLADAFGEEQDRKSVV